MQSGELKNLIWDIVSNTDDVDEAGKVKPRTYYKKDMIRGVQQIKAAIRDQITVELEKEVKKEDGSVAKESCLIPFPEFAKGGFADWKLKQEVHTNSIDLVLTDKMKASLKFYYNEREELPTYVTGEILDELEKIIE